jgi:hypothetical protein
MITITYGKDLSVKVSVNGKVIVFDYLSASAFNARQYIQYFSANQITRSKNTVFFNRDVVIDFVNDQFQIMHQPFISVKILDFSRFKTGSALGNKLLADKLTYHDRKSVKGSYINILS